MNTTKWFLLLGIVLLLVGVGAAIHYPRSAVPYPPDKPVVNGSQAEDTGQNPASGLVCTGYVDLEHRIRSLSPLRLGRVAEIVSKENQHLGAGELILRLESEDAKLQVKAAESAETTAEIQLEEARKLEEQQRARLAQQQAAVLASGFRLDAARQMLLRKEEQLRDNIVAADEVTVRRAEVKALEQQVVVEREKLAELKCLDPSLTVRKAQEQLKLSRIQRDQARRQLEECSLKAPADGSVQHISVGPGDIVTGNPAQSIVRFAPDEPKLIRAEIDQEFVDRVEVGQAAVIRDDTHAGTSWNGKVLRVAGWYEQRRPTSPDPSAFTDIRTVECLISIDPGQPPLRIGQRMRVIIGRVPSSDAR